MDDDLSPVTVNTQHPTSRLYSRTDRMSTLPQILHCIFSLKNNLVGGDYKRMVYRAPQICGIMRGRIITFSSRGGTRATSVAIVGTTHDPARVPERGVAQSLRGDGPERTERQAADQLTRTFPPPLLRHHVIMYLRQMHDCCLHMLPTYVFNTDSNWLC